MTEDEGNTILGGLVDAAGAALDAAGNVASAEVNAASGWVSSAEATGDMFAAAGNEFIGDHAARDAWDAKFEQNLAESDNSFAQAGEDLSNAVDDVF